ncbi:32697_t:CDS:2 [Gigaspora margarita]|uniref:32697_t:CDS:1 n=1 Tax=Gigaspora margarita TaxID=4874 RepID=A0ABM8VXY0_GIGMA|nr:32697_t:CDS:2 [Gigaspora margarita]
MKNTDFEYEFNEFKEKQIIDSGSFSTVYMSYSQKLDSIVALKMFSNKENEDFKEAIIQEVKIMCERKLEHNNIIQVFGITKDPELSEYGLVLHYANNGHLRDYLKKHSLEWSDKFRMAKEIASGINYLHNKSDKDIKQYVIIGGREEPIYETPDNFKNLYIRDWSGDLGKRPMSKKICLELDTQICLHHLYQITNGLKGFFFRVHPSEDRDYLLDQIFQDLVQDKEFAKKFVATFQLEKALKKALENAMKFVKVVSFFCAAALENAVVIANFYFQDAVHVFLNCFSAAVIVTFAAVTNRKENEKAFCVAVFAVERSEEICPIFAVNIAFWAVYWSYQKLV